MTVGVLFTDGGQGIHLCLAGRAPRPQKPLRSDIQQSHVTGETRQIALNGIQFESESPSMRGNGRFHLSGQISQTF